MAEFKGFEQFEGFLSQDPITEARGSDTTLGDYLFDIPKGIIKGGSQAIQGLLQLGALPIDYLADTNLLTNIEKLFNQITPETKTAVGDITSVLTQFGVPGGAALKIASGMSKLKGISQMTKLSSLPSAGAKGVELMKRAGYFGSIGGITDLAVSTPGSMSTLGETLGVFGRTDLEGLTGKERAAEIAKAKVKFGAEGTLLGAATPLLPIAGTLGMKYGIIPGAQAVGYVGGKVLRPVNTAVTKGISLMVGKENTSLIQQGMKKLLSKGGGVEDVIEKDIAKRYIPIEGGFQSEMNRWFTRLKDQFTSPTPIKSSGVRQLQRDFNNKLASEQKKFADISTRIQELQTNIATNFKINFFNKGESKLLIQHESNKIDNLLRAETKQQKLDILNTLDPKVRKDAFRLKRYLDKHNDTYKKFIKDFDLKQSQAVDYKSYMDLNLAGFGNSRFKFNPLVENEAFDFLKARYKVDGDLKKIMVNKTKQQLGTKGLFTKEYKDTFAKTLDDNINKSVKDELLSLKQEAIKSNVDPEKLILGLNTAPIINRLQKMNVMKQDSMQFPDVIKKLFTVEEGALGATIKDPVTGKMITKDIPTINFMNGAVDTVIQQSKQMYGKKAFDAFLDMGLDKAGRPGFIFTEERIAERGLLNIKGQFNNLKQVGRRESGNLALSEYALASDLFNGQYFASPEIANALLGVKEITSQLYNIPFYKSLMTLKAGSQIAKTILSPVTQVRNFTTASMFPVANGLIGMNVGFKDAWRLTAEDIFAGAKTDIEKIGKIENLINRNIVDQNINVQEMRRVLDSAKGGKISFNQLMKTPIMRTLTDVYQGADNYWKIYTDNAYQGLFRTAFGNPDDILKMPTNSVQRTKLETDFFKNVDDWYSTVAKEKWSPINALTGNKKTVVDALEDMSAWLTVNTVPTYSMVPRIIENIRNLPLGNFIAFPAEILRTTSNIVSIGARELTSTNPFIRQMGARRLLGVSMVLGGVGTTIKKTAQYVTGVDDDKMNSFQRSFAADYQKNSTLIPLTSPDADGVFKYYNFSYSNPYDSLVAPVNAILGHYADGTLRKDSVDTIVMNALFSGAAGGDGRKGAITEFLSPFVTESIGTERAADVTLRRGKTTDGKTIYYPQDNGSVRIAKSINHIIGGLEPGAFTSARRIWEGATGKFTDYGTARDTKAEIAALMSGVRIEEAKPLASMPFIMTSYNRDKQNIRSKFSKEAYSAATSPENKLAAFKTYAMETFSSQQKMYNTLQDAQNLGVSKNKLQNILEDRLTQTESNELIRGRFKPPTYSTEALEGLYDRLKREDPEAANRIRSQNRTVERIFDSIQRKLRRVKLDSSLDELDTLIEEMLTPDVYKVRRQTLNLTPPEVGIRTQGPASLPTGITGVQPNQTIITQQQPTLGQQFNLLPTQEKVDLLFGR